MKAKRITLYSTRHCGHCRQAKLYLKQKGLPFQELDIEHNRRASKEFLRLGARGVPVIMIGQTRIDGFDPRRIDHALLNKAPS